ncbi:MAG: M28 family peptidase [Candidatus Bruticola sp.]
MTVLGQKKLRYFTSAVLVGSLLSFGSQACSNKNSATPSQLPPTTQIISATSSNGKISPDLPKTASLFDGSKAWHHIISQVEFGQRFVGSEGSQKTRHWLKENLSDLGLKVYEQKFTKQTPEGPKEFVNIIACLDPENTKQSESSSVDKTDKNNIELTGAETESAESAESAWKEEAAPVNHQDNALSSVSQEQEKIAKHTAIVLGAHYDTKYFKDFAFVGANDGASGTAVLLELARVLKNNPLQKHRLLLCFFDGEEAFAEWSDDDSLYGSRYFVENLGTAYSPIPEKTEDIVAAVIIDMVGDKNLQITYDTISHPQLLEMLFNKGRELKFVKQFKRTNVGAVSDDHLPFLIAKIPAVNIIGFNNNENGLYPSYWHTQEDHLDKVCADSLYVAGSTVDLLTRDLDAILE